MFHWIRYFALLGFSSLQMTGLFSCPCFLNFTSFNFFLIEELEKTEILLSER